VRELTAYLSGISCERLILGGDILDGWQIRKKSTHWSPYDAAFFHLIMEIAEKGGTEVIYLTGNHDDFLDDIAPCEIFGLRILSSYKFSSGVHEVVAIHGHAFDPITERFRWLSKLGARAYNLLLKFNKLWNKNREVTGVGYYSLSKVLKDKVKSTVNLISGFEKDLSNYAIANKCDMIICGHIHHACDKVIGGGVRYLNSGDWVESLTALVEDEAGEWKIEGYGRK